jgi:hypothetical protein
MVMVCVGLVESSKPEKWRVACVRAYVRGRRQLSSVRFCSHFQTSFFAWRSFALPLPSLDKLLSRVKYGIQKRLGLVTDGHRRVTPKKNLYICLQSLSVLRSHSFTLSITITHSIDPLHTHSFSTSNNTLYHHAARTSRSRQDQGQCLFQGW